MDPRNDSTPIGFTPEREGTPEGSVWLGVGHGSSREDEGAVCSVIGGIWPLLQMVKPGAESGSHTGPKLHRPGIGI